MASTSRHPMLARLQRAQELAMSSPSTTVPTATKKPHCKRDAAPPHRSKRKAKVAVTRQTRLDKAVKSQKKHKAVKRSSAAAPANVPQTPTRPSAHQTPTNALPRITRRYNSSPVQLPIRGSSADTALDEENESHESTTAPAPLNLHPSSSQLANRTSPAFECRFVLLARRFRWTVVCNDLSTSS
ncbi:hypothetical protein BDZ89DRAFT_1119414 [Hymenopellis radicata]|nr:hypothetical protein BDZ89DRAFT_1119414 [Hymenopellis radicata]